jgi:hypothetical protein
MSIIRDKAKSVLAQVPETGEVRSDLNPALFKKLTGGVTQEILMENWKSGGIRTVCIDFVCWYAREMGIDIISSIPPKLRNPKVDGFFALQETLTKCGKGYAYVAATKDGPRPECGDILRHGKGAFHVDVAVGFDDKVLLRAAGGQSSHPRPKSDVSKEYDNVLRVRGKGPYDFSNLQGWLDIEKFFSAVEVPDRSKTGSLWFNESGDVVHPDAPAGGGGRGFFRAASPLCATEYYDHLPHPHSSVIRTLDPSRIDDRRERIVRPRRRS